MDSPAATRSLRLRSVDWEERLLLHRFRGHEELGRPYRWVLDLLCIDDPPPAEELLGESMAVEIVLPAGGTRQFHGAVSRVRHLNPRGRFGRLELTLVPALWKLSLRRDCRIFQHTTVLEIAQTLLGEHGVSDYDSQLTEEPPEEPFLVQYNETDLDFLHRLFEERGLHYAFDHGLEFHTLLLRDDNVCCEAARGYETIPYHRTGGRDAPPEAITSWSSDASLLPDSYTLGDYDSMTPKRMLQSTAVGERHTVGDCPDFAFPGGFSADTEDDRIARRRYEAAVQSLHQRDGEASARGLRAGCTFGLGDAPAEGQEGPWLVLSVEHEAEMDVFESDGGLDTTGESVYSCRFRAMPADQEYKPTLRTPKPEIHGTQTAIVTGDEGRRVQCDDESGVRVTVRFHWDRRGTADSMSSCPVRVAQPWAGQRMGGVFIPRVGTEVVVSFENGDPDRPMIIGAVHNSAEHTPWELPEQEQWDGLYARSHDFEQRHGHAVVFMQKPGQERLHIQAITEQVNNTEGDYRQLVTGERHVTVEKKSRSEYQKEHHTTVEKDDILTVGGSGHTGITGDCVREIGGALDETAGDVTQDYGSVTQTVSGTFSLDAAEIKLTGSGGITLEAGGAKISISGGMVNISAPGGLQVDAPMAKFSAVAEVGAMLKTPMLQTDLGIITSVVGASYTPGAGNLM